MNSGAPAATAPPDFSSLGMMASHRKSSVAYCGAEKYLGAYFPAGAAAFSLCTIWWTYSAASAGITCSTDPPTAPTASVLNMSRLLILSFAMVGLTTSRRGFNTEFTGDTEKKRTGRAGQAPPLQVCGNAIVSGILEVALLCFLQQIFGGAPGERHDRERRILIRIGDQRPAIGDKQILHAVRLAEAIEHGGFRIGAHARGAHLVNNLAAFLNPEGILAVDGSLGPVFTAHGFDDGAKRLLHVLGLEQLVIRPLEVETQRGDAPLIDDVGIDLAVGVRVGKHFAAAGEVDVRAVDLASALLQLRAVAFFIVTQTMEHADAGHIASPAHLDVIAAGKIILAVELPPRHVHVHSADAVVIVRRHLPQLRE